MMRPARMAPSQRYTLPAPMRGLVLNENISASGPQGARLMENWFPTEDGVRVRRGATRIASVTGAVTSMFSYEGASTSRLFAATESSIYDVTSYGDPDVVETAKVHSQTAGYYSTARMSTAGGDFLVAVNGADNAQLYDGSNFYPLLGVAVRMIAYDAKSAAFTKGETVTGGTSTATGVIVGERIDSATTGRLYLTGVSGTFQDNEALTDGATGAATADGADASAQAATITGVATSALSNVWAFKTRLFFIEKDTLKVWFLPVQSIGGAAADLNLAGVFRKGGALMFGATWSLDSGDGMDDRCVIVSTLGEVAVYEGTDPSSASTWAIVGRYDISRPLGPKCYIRAGGDIIIGTEDGAVALSQVVQKNPAALTASAVSLPIEPDWRASAAARTAYHWEAAQSSANGWAIVSQPTTTTGAEKRVFVVNLKTGAWAVWTGWDVIAMAERAGQVYFGTSGGAIQQAESGSLDDGSSYLCRFAMGYDHIQSVATYKHLHMARATLRANGAPKVGLSVSKNYEVDFPPAPAVTVVGDGDLWGTGTWGTASWYVSQKRTVFTNWVSLPRNAVVAALQVQILMGGGADPEIDLASIDLLYATGGMVV